MSEDTFKERLQLGLVIAVIAWGIYLATGAVLGPRNFGDYQADYRKGLVILVTTSGFVAFWAFAYVAAKRKALYSATKASGAAADQTAKPPAIVGWNFASAFGFLLATAVASAMAAAAWGGWKASGAAFAAMFGIAAASGIASIVGLSNPTRNAGRWLGLIALGLLGAAFVMGFYV